MWIARSSTMMEEVENAQPFDSFYAFAELEDLPYLDVKSSAFECGFSSEGPVRDALLVEQRH